MLLATVTTIKQRLTTVGTRCADHVTPLYQQKLALTSPTGGGRSVGIVRVRTKDTEFSLVYNDIAALPPWERYILYPFRHTAISQLLCSIRVEAVKLAQVGFGDFLAGTRVRRLKGKCDDIKTCILLIKFVTVPDTNKLIVNSKV